MKVFKAFILFCLIIAIVILWCDKRIETFPAVVLILCFVFLVVEMIFGKKKFFQLW